jgi:hypothetical protein
MAAIWKTSGTRTSADPQALQLLQENFPAEYQKIRFPASAGFSLKPVSQEGTDRLVRAAITYALRHKRKSVTLVHKGNIMKYTEGAFRDWAYELAKREFGAVEVHGFGIEGGEQVNLFNGGLDLFRAYPDDKGVMPAADAGHVVLGNHNGIALPDQGLGQDLADGDQALAGLPANQDVYTIVPHIIFPLTSSYSKTTFFSANVPGGWLAAFNCYGTVVHWRHESQVYPSNDTVEAVVPLSDVVTSHTADKREDWTTTTRSGTHVTSDTALLPMPVFTSITVT